MVTVWSGSWSEIQPPYPFPCNYTHNCVYMDTMHLFEVSGLSSTCTVLLLPFIYLTTCFGHLLMPLCISLPYYPEQIAQISIHSSTTIYLAILPFVHILVASGFLLFLPRCCQRMPLHIHLCACMKIGLA